MLDGLVGLVVGDFKFAGRRMVMIGPMVKSAVGQRTAEALVEEPEPERDLQTFGRETVGIAGTVAFEQAVTLQLAEIVAELVQSVGFRREPGGGEDGFMDLPGRPAADGCRHAEALPGDG